MKFNHKSILKRLTQKFNTSVRLNSENLARFLNYSSPHFIHKNDIVQLSIDNQLVEMPVYQSDGINQDFEDFIKKYKGWYVEILNPEAIVILPMA